MTHEAINHKKASHRSRVRLGAAVLAVAPFLYECTSGIGSPQHGNPGPSNAEARVVNTILSESESPPIGLVQLDVANSIAELGPIQDCLSFRLAS